MSKADYHMGLSRIVAVLVALMVVAGGVGDYFAFVSNVAKQLKLQLPSADYYKTLYTNEFLQDTLE